MIIPEGVTKFDVQASPDMLPVRLKSSDNQRIAIIDGIISQINLLSEHLCNGSNKGPYSSPTMENVIEADVDPALFRGVTVYVVRPTATEGVPEIVHDVGERVTPVGRAGETEHDVSAVPPVQVIMIVGKVLLAVNLTFFRLVYEHPIGAMTSKGISVGDVVNRQHDDSNDYNYRSEQLST